MDDTDITIEVLSEEYVFEILPETTDLTLDLNSFSIAGSGAEGYVYTRSTPLNIWTINHNLGFKPVVQAFNNGSQQIEGEVIHTSVNQTVIYYSTPVQGFARLI